MTNVRKLARPPLTEAVIDVRVRPRDGFDPHLFEAAAQGLSGRFPRSEPRTAGKMTFTLGPGGARKPDIEDLGMQGVFFHSADETLIAQFRVDGFSLNRLAPYSSWEELWPLALELWEAYRTISLPASVTRLALRYINKISLPGPLHSYAEYLRVVPVLPPELPQHVTAFMARTTIADQDSHCAAHITHVFPLSGPKGEPTMVLDIDAFTEFSLGPTDLLLAPRFEELRVLKNRIFFSYLTEKALEGFG